jgi:hypothetical protein
LRELDRVVVSTIQGDSMMVTGVEIWKGPQRRRPSIGRPGGVGSYRDQRQSDTDGAFASHSVLCALL